MGSNICQTENLPTHEKPLRRIIKGGQVGAAVSARVGPKKKSSRPASRWIENAHKGPGRRVVWGARVTELL